MIAGCLALADYLVRGQPWLCGLCFTALVLSIIAQVGGLL